MSPCACLVLDGHHALYVSPQVEMSFPSHGVSLFDRHVAVNGFAQNFVLKFFQSFVEIHS